MRANPIAEALKGAFTGGNITPSEPDNTHVTLASQAEPAAPDPAPNHGDKDGDGKMPEALALKGDRARALKEIAERRNAQAVEEGNESVSDPDAESNPTPEPEAGADLGGQDPEATTPGDQAPVVEAAPAKEETRRLVIDGRSVDVSKIYETGERALQKEMAADVRLHQATQILEEAKRIAAPPIQAEPALAEKTPEELAEVIQFGTKEAAAEAIKFILNRSAPAVKPEEIVRAAQQAVAPAMAFEEGKKFVQKEYGDLLNDSDFRAIFLNKENALRAAGDQRGYVELYTAIGEEMRQKFGRPKQGAATPAPQPSTQGRTLAEKHEAKAKAPAAPRLASARLDGDGAQPKPPTREQVFDKMRAARGFRQHSQPN
jgi:hypothetical protein